jgi:nitronate monooxygenase
MFKTRICDQLGIDVPIIQAPVAAGIDLALAVASAGGLGMLQGSWLPVADIEPLLDSVACQNVGINFVLAWPQEERFEHALEAGARIISIAWGDAAPFVRRTHAAGAVLLASVSSADEARKAEAAGVDIVVAQGWEAGGHVWGDIATMALVPSIVDAVSIPVIASGGIADGRGIAAALALGADGVWLGTRFVASLESPHLYKERIVAANETDARYTMVFGADWDAPHRVLRNRALDQGKSRPYAPPSSAAELDSAAMYAGQSAALVNEIKPVGEIVRDLIAETDAALQRVS